MKAKLTTYAAKLGRWLLALLLIQIRLRVFKEYVIAPIGKVHDAIHTGYPQLGVFQWKSLDGRYRVCTQEMFERIIKLDWTDYRQYQAEWFDCDDYAFSLMGRVRAVFGLNCIGVVIDNSPNSNHAYCVVVLTDSEGNLYAKLLEPQDDKWVVAGQPPYELKKGTVII